MKIIKDGIVFTIHIEDNVITDKFYNAIYDNLVEKIIYFKYSTSNIEAVINNYLSDMSNEEYVREFNELQDWRKKAKSVARKVNDFIQENDLINKPDGAYEIKDEDNL